MKEKVPSLPHIYILVNILRYYVILRYFSKYNFSEQYLSFYKCDWIALDGVRKMILCTKIYNGEVFKPIER